MTFFSGYKGHYMPFMKDLENSETEKTKDINTCPIPKKSFLTLSLVKSTHAFIHLQTHKSVWGIKIAHNLPTQIILADT